MSGTTTAMRGTRSAGAASRRARAQLAASSSSRRGDCTRTTQGVDRVGRRLRLGHGDPGGAAGVEDGALRRRDDVKGIGDEQCGLAHAAAGEQFRNGCGQTAPRRSSRACPLPLATWRPSRQTPAHPRTPPRSRWRPRCPSRARAARRPAPRGPAPRDPPAAAARRIARDGLLPAEQLLVRREERGATGCPGRRRRLLVQAGQPVVPGKDSGAGQLARPAGRCIAGPAWRGSARGGGWG